MTESGQKIRVLIVDDAALMRATIKQLLASDPAIEVVDTAGSGPVAIAKIKQLRPDVVTLDVEMPGMDGIDLLRTIMADAPVPVVMLSAHTQHGAQRTLDALEAGAVDYVPKPTGQRGATLRDVAAVLCERVRSAAAANLRRVRPTRPKFAPSASPSVPSAKPRPTVTAGPSSVIAIGISCGGPATLVEIFPQLPPDSPPIVITQHMPPGFTRSFADRLNRLSALHVKEAEDGDVLAVGRAFVAPGDAHMLLQGAPGRLRIKLERTGPVCGHMPSVDVLFRSVAKTCGAAAVGVIMTGMGNDGAAALGAIRDAGGRTVAQDQPSCIVFGMPKAAIDMGHAQHIVPLDQIVPTVLELATCTQPVGT